MFLEQIDKKTLWTTLIRINIDIYVHQGQQVQIQSTRNLQADLLLMSTISDRKS